jgi:LPXTG-motif cell wall-anchored protein
MLKKLAATIALASVLTFSAAPSMAFAEQTGTNATTNGTTANTYNGTNWNNNGYGANNYRAYATNDNTTDWGWLGLLGLIGLAGLFGRNREKDEIR